MANEWKNRATPVTGIQLDATSSDWKNRAEAVQSAPAPRSVDPSSVADPNDMGPAAATLQGFNSAVPFGERIVAGLGAGLATGYSTVAGLEDPGIAANYDQIRRMQETTREANPNAYMGGTVAGIGNTILLGVPTAAGRAAATQGGIRGGVNAIPEALSSVGNWVGGSKVAADAGRLAKAGNLAGKAVRGAAVAGPSGALYSYGASEHDLDSPEALDDAALGGGVAATFGAAAPIVGAAAGSVVPKVSEEVADLARVAKDKFGIDISLDQLAPSRTRDTAQKISQSLPFSGVEGFQERQAQQWHKAVANTIGEESDNLGPDTIKRYLDRAGQDFDTALKGKTLEVKQSDLAAIQDIALQAKGEVTADVAKVVKNNVNDFINDLSPFKVGEARTVPGEVLASLRSKIIKKLPRVDGKAREHVGDIVDQIDDVIMRHLSPEETQTLSTARYQWRNFRTLEPLLEKATDGTITPNQLLQRIASSKFIKASRKSLGEDDLVDLGRIGKKLMTKKGGSDTVPNLLLGGGTLGNVGLVAAAPQAAIPAMLAQGTAMGLNRGYQSLINQSPSVVRRAIDKSSSPQLLEMLAAEGAPQLIK